MAPSQALLLRRLRQLSDATHMSRVSLLLLPLCVRAIALAPVAEGAIECARGAAHGYVGLGSFYFCIDTLGAIASSPSPPTVARGPHRCARRRSSCCSRRWVGRAARSTSAARSSTRRWCATARRSRSSRARSARAADESSTTSRRSPPSCASPGTSTATRTSGSTTSTTTTTVATAATDAVGSTRAKAKAKARTNRANRAA